LLSKSFHLLSPFTYNEHGSGFFAPFLTFDPFDMVLDRLEAIQEGTVERQEQANQLIIKHDGTLAVTSQHQLITKSARSNSSS
jgi:hypothetical protein